MFLKEPGVIEYLLDVIELYPYRVNGTLMWGAPIYGPGEITLENNNVLPKILQFSSNEDPNIREAMCYLLSLINESNESINALQRLSIDPNVRVRETANKLLTELEKSR
jgi:hypothetical protein